ncbi:hypothetical protein BS50DRAFT_573696 [Corynespora cassiicola Philippines]|uniref:STB6-like N-terminal domain-containing protein n=1 Tax=Corynespora cassiicola Philippines TaxID=1448308 RepID=A0A2T2NNG2_CORCC|nr:hypothetical protein BS50DRAFT_573696 [Corynespora cassiicola Philippines]
MAHNLPISAMRADTERELRRRMPRLQTSPSDTKTITNSTTSSRLDHVKSPATDAASPSEPMGRTSLSASHQRFVLTDHVAFRYLEEDPKTVVLAHREKLEGYEVYLVEQWACSRTDPTFVITTYTGDPKDSVWVSVISVPTDEEAWSPQMRIYFKALDQFHARRKETRLGTLMITNLSAFPSSLTVIPVPDGDVKKSRELFFVNENLKRLGCSGRLGIKLAPPNGATQAKFHQLYRTSDKIPLNSAVIELVKLCQVALVMFGTLAPEYADGLLCDVTEKAVNDWWVEFGAEYYTVEPQDGILGPTTVAALLGMYMGARNRLSAYNAPVAKDAFDVESTKRGIAYFQKSQRIQRTRRLDRQTLERLRRATAKAASKESWAVPRAFKSTVAELGGKGGEMVMGMVGAGEKAGIADIETVDIDRFVELAQGEHAKWLWYGKPRKSNTGDMFSRLPDDGPFSPDGDRSHASRLLKRESTLEGHSLSRRITNEESRISTDTTREALEKESDLDSKKGTLKKATGKLESGSGFHRIRDAVSRRHQSKHSKAENGRIHLDHTQSDVGFARPPTSDSSQDHNPNRDSMSELASPHNGSHEPLITKTLTETPGDAGSMNFDKLVHAQTDGVLDTKTTGKPPTLGDEDSTAPPTVENSIAGSVYRGIELNDILPVDETSAIPASLRRTRSADQLWPYRWPDRTDDWYPRHLSFSIAEDSILTWPSITAADEDESSLEAAYAAQQLLSEDAKRLRLRLALLASTDASWVESRLQAVSVMDEQADNDIAELDELYQPRFEEYQALREDAHELISRERMQLQEAIRDLETLGAKLDYEISTLRSKVDDVEDGVKELEKQIDYVEDRARELEDVCAQREGWVHWGVRILTGIGRHPA